MIYLRFTIWFFIMVEGFWNIMNRLRMVMNWVRLMLCGLRMVTGRFGMMMVGFMNMFREVVNWIRLLVCGFRMVNRFRMVMGRFWMVVNWLRVIMNRFRMVFFNSFIKLFMNWLLGIRFGFRLMMDRFRSVVTLMNRFRIRLFMNGFMLMRMGFRLMMNWFRMVVIMNGLAVMWLEMMMDRLRNVMDGFRVVM